MYASIRRYRTPQPEEVRRRVEVGFLPMLRKQPGFVSYTLVHDGNGVMISVTVFQTREGAEDSNRLAAEWIAWNTSAGTAWIVFAIFFGGGWVFQLVGHVWEGRRPALMDNLFQAFIGPMFIMAEVLVLLGLKPELKSAIEGPAH